MFEGWEVRGRATVNWEGAIGTKIPMVSAGEPHSGVYGAEIAVGLEERALRYSEQTISGSQSTLNIPQWLREAESSHGVSEIHRDTLCPVRHSIYLRHEFSWKCHQPIDVELVLHIILCLR